MTTVAAAQAYPHWEHRPVTFTHVFRSTFGLAFLAVCGFEAGAPVLGYAAGDAVGYGVTAAALIVSGLYGLWR